MRVNEERDVMEKKLTLTPGVGTPGVAGKSNTPIGGHLRAKVAGSARGMASLAIAAKEASIGARGLR